MHINASKQLLEAAYLHDRMHFRVAFNAFHQVYFRFSGILLNLIKKTSTLLI
jgi:hypothetical protein